MTRTTAIQESQKMIKAIARKYYRPGRGNDFLDLVQEGNIGVLIAFNKFDPEREVKFQTYAAFWVRRKIQDLVFKKHQKVEVFLDGHIEKTAGNHNPEVAFELQEMLDKMIELKTVEQKVLWQRALGSTLKEIGDELGYTRERIRQIQRDAGTKIRSEGRTILRRQCTA